MQQQALSQEVTRFMATPTRKVFEGGVERELTANELEQRLLDEADYLKDVEAIDAQAAAKLSAKNKLAALGFTIDEIAALIG